MHDIHPAAALGYAGGADTYVRGRPGFPPESQAWLRDDLGLCQGKAVVELGAGTGKFTRLLIETGASVTAVEPVAAMLEHLQRSFPQVASQRGTDQAVPLPDATADAVVCAQSFHWFATAESLAEIRRVLKPGGVLGLIWNVRDQSVPWVAQLTRIIEPFEGDAPRYDNGEWRAAFPAKGFGELRQRTFPHAHVGPPEQVIVDRIASVSFIAALDRNARNHILDEVRALISRTPDLAGREKVIFPYVTHAYWTRKV